MPVKGKFSVQLVGPALGLPAERNNTKLIFESPGTRRKTDCKTYLNPNHLSYSYTLCVARQTATCDKIQFLLIFSCKEGTQEYALQNCMNFYTWQLWKEVTYSQYHFKIYYWKYLSCLWPTWPEEKTERNRRRERIVNDC